MKGIRKDYKLKIAALTMAAVFSVTSTAYSIDLPQKSHLRVPLSGNNERMDEANDSIVGTNGLEKPAAASLTVTEDGNHYPASMPTNNQPNRKPTTDELNKIVEAFGGKTGLEGYGVYLYVKDTVISPSLPAPAAITNEHELYVNPKILEAPMRNLRPVFAGYMLYLFRQWDKKSIKYRHINYLLNSGALEDFMQFIQDNEIGLDMTEDWFDAEIPLIEDPLNAEALQGTALVVFADEYGRYGEMLMGYPYVSYIHVRENSITIQLRGNSIEELKSDFFRRFPKFQKYGLTLVPDGKTWLASYGGLSDEQSEDKPVMKTMTSSGQTVRIPPESYPFYFGKTQKVLDLSKAWTPFLKVVLESIQQQDPETHKRIQNGELIIAHNGQLVADLTETRRLKRGDEIAILPGLKSAPYQTDEDQRQSPQMITITDLSDPAQNEALTKFIMFYYNLSPKLQRIVDLVHKGDDEREILAQYLSDRLYSYRSLNDSKDRALIKFKALGYDRSLVAGWLKKIDDYIANPPPMPPTNSRARKDL